MIEEWKPVIGYEGLYEVSNLGQVRSSVTSNLLKTHRTKKGYSTVSIRVAGKSKNMLVHRLVAMSFLENKHNKPTVNHKDGNKSNNHIKNLEWASYSENNTHSWRVLKRIHPLLGVRYGGRINAKRVLRIQEGKVTEFDSITRAAEDVGGCPGGICAAIKKKGNYKNSKWAYSFGFISAGIEKALLIVKSRMDGK